MNRRAFLSSLLATAVLDPEKLLWVPGRKTIFVPPVSFTSAELVMTMEQFRTRYIHPAIISFFAELPQTILDSAHF